MQFLGGFSVVAAGALIDESFAITWTGQVVFALAWLVLVLSVGAISLLYVMIRRGNVSKVAGLFFLVPGVTAIIAWFLFAESLLPVQVAGMAVCALAVLMVSARRQRGAR